MTDKTLSPGAALAAVDMGSNSFRLEIATLQHGRYRRVDYLKETVRLGAGLDADGLLTGDAVERGLACLRRFATRLAGFSAVQVRAVATQTLREARNRDAFLLQAQQALGFPIEVISGREEARLIYAGVAQLQPSEEPRLVVDIGGRSTELILGQGRVPQVAESFAVGSVSLSIRYFGDGRFTAEAFRAAQVAAGAEFEEALQTFRRNRWRQALGSSGTAGAVGQLLQASGQGAGDGRITPDGLRWCIERCISAGHTDQLELAGLKADRRPVIGGGLAILYTLASQFDIHTLLPAKGALRQGVIVDLHQRLTAGRQRGDLRDESVAALQRRFDVDAAQADRVRHMALALYERVRREPAGAEAEDRRELGWACALHELGLMVSHHDHHRHSAYLMAHVDAPGFSQSQQRRVGELVLGQRGGLRKIELALTERRFAWQVLSLRLAVIASHARDPHTPPWQLRAEGDSARLSWPAGWERGQERTLHLLREEAAIWQRHGPLKLLLPA